MADKHKVKEVIIVVVALIVLIGGFFLLKEYGASTGKAMEMPEGFYWEEGQNPELNAWEFEVDQVCEDANLKSCTNQCNFQPKCTQDCVKNACPPKPTCGDKNPTETKLVFSKGSKSMLVACCTETKEKVCGISPSPQKPLYFGCYKKNSYISIVKNFNLLCDEHQGELGWFICDKEGMLSSNGKFLCEISKSSAVWTVCNKDSEGTVDSKSKYLCTGKEWIVCDNKIESPFCVNNKWDFITFFKDAELALGGDKNKKGSSVKEAVDISLNQIFFNRLKSKGVVYFKYKDNYYTISLSEDNKLSVSALSKEIGLIKTETLTTEGKVHFKPLQMDLDLDKDKKIDAYLNVVGGSPYVGQDKEKLLIVVSPKLDFDNPLFSDESITLLSSGNGQEFTFSGDFSFTLFHKDLSYILIIGKKEYVATKDSSDTHYLDEMKQKKVSFKVLGTFNDLAIIQFSTTKEEISVAVAPQKEVLLSKLYEAYFDNKAVLNIKDIVNNVEFGLVGICENDPKVLNVLTVCNKTQEIFVLKEEEVHVEGNLLFTYYPPKEGTKTGNVYNIIDLDKEQEALAVIFANNLVEGKSVALKAHGEYYLLSSEKSNYLDLTKLKLKQLGKDKEAEFLADGNQEEIVFDLPLGKQINIKLKAEPTLRYILSSVIIQKKDVDLINELQTRFSTYSKIKVTTPTIGEIAVNDAKDIKLMKNTMKIIYNNKEVELIKGKPYVDTFDFNKDKVSALFYYNKFAVSGKSEQSNTYAKYADVYLYADLTQSSFVHGFNSNNFILPLVKGNSIALGLEKKFYLLSYSKPWTGKEADGFDSELMQLVSLDNQEIFPAKADGDILIFNLGENKIEVLVDTNKNTITFIGKTVAQVGKKEVEFTSEENFAATLVPGTEKADTVLKVRNSSKFNFVEYKICDEGDIKNLQSQVYLCPGNKEDKLGISEIKKSGAISYKYLGLVDGQKTILFQHVFSLPQKILWTKASDNLAQGKYPLISVNEKSLELQGGKELSLFVLIDKDNNKYPILMQSDKEAYENGTIVVGDKQVFFQKELEQKTIYLTVKLLEAVILSGKMINVTESQTFVTQVGGDTFNIAISDLSPMIQVNIKNSNGEIVFVGLMPKEAKKSVLLSDGRVITLQVLDVGKNIKVGLST